MNLSSSIFIDIYLKFSRTKLNEKGELLLHLIRAFSRYLGHGYIFWGTFHEKEAFFLTLPKLVLLLTISNENIFLRTQAGRLGAIVAPNKDVE